MNLNLVLEDDLKKLEEKIDKLTAWLMGVNNVQAEKIYTNKDLCKKLNVCSKTLQHYRNSGMLSFNQVGRKIYYTENEIQEFLKNHKVKQSITFKLRK